MTRLYRQIPTNLFSNYFGRVADKRFPPKIQENINRLYIRLFNIDMSRFEQGPFATLNALFTRRLKEPVAPEGQSDTLVSPCDAKIVGMGEIKNGRVYQVKLMNYELSELIPGLDAKAYKGGSFLNLYLSPKDYHRYHAPLDMEVLEAVHIPGHLYPVNMPALTKIKNLYIENERVLLRCRSTKEGEFWMVFVGALNVGRMLFGFDPRIQNNARARMVTRYTYEGVHLARGAEMGMFQMGSTILLFFPSGAASLVGMEGMSVRVGQQIGQLK